MISFIRVCGLLRELNREIPWKGEKEKPCTYYFPSALSVPPVSEDAHRVAPSNEAVMRLNGVVTST